VPDYYEDPELLGHSRSTARALSWSEFSRRGINK
jgi:hypothetical protein